MIRILVACLAFLSMARVLPASGNDPHTPVPLIATVEPDTGKAGHAVQANGTSLDKSVVAGLYLIQDENTTEVKITSQTEAAIKFTVPGAVKPGRYRLMVLTNALNPQYIEEPVFFTVE